jgi:imidazole glycerol-phosphate synthase subunit HisF
MKFNRIISRLDIKGPNLVKGIHLEGLRVLGNPEIFAEYYFAQGVDELFYQDVVASLYQRNSLIEKIKKTAKNISIPLTVGGGIRSIEDIQNILNAGADKVVINTGAVKDPLFINRAVKIFGTSTIAVAIETLKDNNGKYYVYTDNGREFNNLDAIKWALEIEKRGAGEILVTSIDKEGTGEGFDIELLKTISSKVKIPVIAHGGAGKDFHVKEIFNQTQIDGVALSSLFHYGSLKKLKKKLIANSEGNTEFIKKGTIFKRFFECSISSLKKYLHKNKIKVRI